MFGQRDLSITRKVGRTFHGADNLYQSADLDRSGVAKSARREQNRAALDQFLIPLDLAEFDELAADACGTVRAALEAQGKPIGPLDTLIAGHALSLNVVMVTHNVAEFRRVSGLRADDWLKTG